MATSTRMLGLTLLGPVALYRGGLRVALPVRKSMALLLLLARHRTPLPRNRIAALLWPDLDEPAARRNLRRELARLRESGAGDAVEAAGDSVGLHPDVVVDAAAFDDAIADGRVDDALALWRGAPADGFALGEAAAFDDWLTRERALLNEQRRRALQLSAAAHEAGGDMRSALDRIDALLADDPLQEQHHRDAIRLLAATGRREAALARYERCRALLRDELGLEPMAETEALAASLRATGGAAAEAQAPRFRPLAAPGATTPIRPAAASSAAPLTPLPAQLPFVGRDAEVAAMETAWAAGRAIVVEGEGGVGKTRLTTDFVAAHGPFAIARCRAGDGDVPYASFARAMRALMGPTPALPDLPGWIGIEIARLVPELGATTPAPLRSDEERGRFFEGCAQAWLRFSADDFDAVVFDDWHLADAASRTLLAFVARRRHEAGGGGAREIVVLRPELDAEARDVLHALVASTAAAQLQLQPLSGAEVFELVRRLSGAAEPTRFAGRLSRATGGNAFFLAETLRHLVESQLLTVDADGAWQTPFDASTEDYREIPVPASVHEAVLARARRLDASTRRVLEAAALSTEPFAPALLAPACALSELEAVLAIEAGVGAGLLHEHAAGGYAFAHDLVQQSIATALPAERRRLVHRRLALGAEAAGAPPATVAAHHEASGDRLRAVAHRLAAGDEAQRLHALAEAMAQWRKALADGPAPAQAVPIHDRLRKAAFQRNDLATLREQADALGRLADDHTLAPADRVSAAIGRALALARVGQAAEALAVLDALPGEPGGRQRFEALLGRASALSMLGRTDESGLAVQQALALPDLTDFDRLDLLEFGFASAYGAGRHDAALAHADSGMALAARLGDDVRLAQARLRRGIVLNADHDTAAAAREFQSVADAASRLGLVRLERAASYNLSCVHASDGRHAQALEAAERGWRLDPPLEAGDFFRVLYRNALVEACCALGRLGRCWEEAAVAVAEALDGSEPRPRIVTANNTLELLGMFGETERARRLVAGIDLDSARRLKSASDETWVAIAQFEMRHGDLAAAAAAIAELDASGDATVTRVRMRAAQARAELALRRGDAAAAIDGLPADDALGMNDEMRARGLALRVAAEAHGGELAATTVEAAQARLALPPVHAIASLELHAALAAARRAGAARAPEEAASAHAAFAAGLARSLHRHPTQRAAFERGWSR